MYKPPKIFKTVQQAIDCCYETNIRWQKYAGAPSSTINSSLIWFTDKVHSPGFPISEIHEPWVWMELIEKMKNPPMGKPRQNSTINKVMINVGSALNHTKKRYPDRMPHGPWNLIANFGLPESEGRVVFYELGEIEQIADSCRRLRGEDLEDAVWFSALTGARQGEVLNLRAEQIDLRRNTVFFEQTKQDSWREVPIEGSMLKGMLERRLEADPDPKHKVFGDYFSDRHQLRDQYEDCVKSIMPAGKRYCWHTIRNTFIITMADLGYSVEDIRRMMCHSSTRVTERYLIGRDKAKKNMIADLSTLVAALRNQQMPVGV